MSSWLSSAANGVGSLFGYGDIGDTIGGYLDSAASIYPGTTGIGPVADGNVYGRAIADTAKDKGFWSTAASSLASPSVLSGLLGGGAQLFGQLSKNDADSAALKQQAEDRKLEYLLGLAKLKYGNQGGGGSGRNRNADIIEAMAKGTDQQLQALNQLQSGYIGALK